MRFKDKVVIVTGSASGIGLATARKFAAEGAILVLADLNTDKLAQAKSEVMQSGLANAVAFLASSEASFVQGAMLRVDGGRLDKL